MWQPTAKIETLKKRAEILAKIRYFFEEREVLEVETPLLSQATVTEPHIHSLRVTEENNSYYLQTSPEYAMKRLLVAGSGSIYQICKAFRQGDRGKKHNPEFTILEWYRVGFDHHQLMDEMEDFLKGILGIKQVTRVTYQDLFQELLNLDPHTISLTNLQKIVEKQLDLSYPVMDKKTCLEVLFSHCIEPTIGSNYPYFVYDFPIEMASLARIRNEDPPLASRFEVYYKGMELANGFHELNQADEQLRRFRKDLQTRQKMGFHLVPIDELFISALRKGLPDCAGVAMGIDRLIMLALEKKNITDVISFPIERA